MANQSYREDLLAFLHRPNMFVINLTQGSMDCPFDISPNDFLDYAKRDIESNLSHKYVNALANTKRSLDSQLLCVFSSLGLNNRRIRKMGLEGKMQILQKMGLVTPRILKKVGEIRNLMEHEFINPSQEFVIDMLDVVSLFVAYTDTMMMNYSTEVTVAIENESYEPGEEFVSLVLDSDQSVLEVSSSFSDEVLRLTPNDDDFYVFAERLLFIRWGIGTNPMV